MGCGSSFSFGLSTKGGKIDFVNKNDIKDNNLLARKLLKELDNEKIKYTKEDIVFIAKLKNGRKIFFEKSRLHHIILRHAEDFKKAFGVNKENIASLLSETILKGKLIHSHVKMVNGRECYYNKYYYHGKYTIVYGIANNGYIETAYPQKEGDEIK